MSVESLSNELIEEIIRLIPRPALNVSLCSRRLHHLAEPIIYASISLLHKTSYPAFMKVIAAKPYLTNHVKQFQTYAQTARWDFDLSSLTKANRAWIREALPDAVYGKHYCDGWYDNIFAFEPKDDIILARTWDAIVAFLLVQFPRNLESIKMESYGSMVADYAHIDTVLSQVAKDQSVSWPLCSLSNLYLVSIKHFFDPNLRYRDDRGSLKFVMPYLALKSVTKIRLSNPCDAMIFRAKDTASINNFSVTDLTISKLNLSMETLLQFLLCFHSIKRFEYHHFLSFTENLPYYVGPTYIRKGLANSSQSLEELVLTSSNGDPWAVLKHDTKWGSLGPLKDFVKLK